MTDVEICNLALASIGEATQITSLSDGSTRANQCLLELQAAVDDLLSETDWQWCTKRVEIAASGTTPDFGFSYQYNLPNDFVRLVKFFSNIHTFKIERDSSSNLVLLTDASGPLAMVYVYRANVSQMHPKMHQALRFLLASRLANSIAGNDNLSQIMEGKYRRALARAKGVNGMSASNDGSPAYDIQLTRWGAVID